MPTSHDRARWLFVAGAIWNIAVGLGGIIAPQAMASRVYRVPLPADNPTALFAWSDFAACVLLFGVGYAIVARNPAANHGIVWLGIIGKLGFVAVWSYRLTQGEVVLIGAVPVAIDALFALAFMRFLYLARRHRSGAPPS